MEKWLILQLAQEMYKMSLKHLVVPEIRKWSNQKPNTALINNTNVDGAQLKQLPVVRVGTTSARKYSSVEL